MKTNGLILLLLLCAVQVFPQNKVGTTAAPFLGIFAGPRATAMGGAFVAVASDPSALYWNPAGISRTGATAAMFEHAEYLIGTGWNFFAATVALDEYNAVGVSVTNVAYGSEEVTTDYAQEGTGEYWDASDWAIGVSYARNLTDRFSIGATGKMIIQKIWREQATGYALDLGLLFISPFNDLKIGMAISNYGTDMQLAGEDLLVTYDPDPSVNGNNKKIPAEYYTGSYSLPLFFRLGVAMDAIKSDQHRWTLAVDAIHSNDNAQTLNVGTEYAWNNMVFLRVGFRSLGMPDREGGLTAGAGISYDLQAGLNIKVDYAYQDFGLLKSVNKFSLSIGF